MNWLYSIVLAGLMFTSDGDLSPVNHQTSKNQETSSIVRLDEIERFEQTYPFNADGRVNVSNVNGSIIVEAWDRKEIKLEAVKIADSRENLADVDIKIDARQDSFSVEADYEDTRNRGNKAWTGARKLEVQFRLSVPRTALLNEIETVNGSVTVSNFVNFTKVSAVNGEVKATNLRGNANLSTVNGTVEAIFDRLDTGSKISLETVNGRVNLIIPSDSNATITADTLNGSINNDFGLPVRKGEYVGRDLYGRIGNGNVEIRLNSVNGGLTIGRKNDGKSINPATNLLPQKKDGDGDDYGSHGVNQAKINREIAKAVSSSQKEAAKKARTAKKVEADLSVLGPEIEKLAEQAIKQSLEAINQASIEINTEELKEKLKEAEKIKLEKLPRIANVNWVSGAPTVEKKTGSFVVKGVPSVTIEAKGCSVTVRGWDKPEVMYAVKKISRTRIQPPVDIKVEQADSDVNIEVENFNRTARAGGIFDDNNNVSVEVYVPKKSNLRITANGEIRLENVSGEIELNGDDEAINVRDSSGILRVAAADGRIRIVGFRGEVEADSDAGETYLEGDFEKLSAETVDGTIVLTLPDNFSADIETNLKDINMEGFSLVPAASGGENIFRWKLGKGGAKYRLLTSADGKISLRNKKLLQIN
jgi:DUF4097 and DUF4098 domain-containing protein YvlB